MGEPQVKEKVLPQQSHPVDRAGLPGFLLSRGPQSQSQLRVWHLSTMGPGAGGLKGVSGPAPGRCVQAECFDQLVRHCVACSLLRTPDPRAAGASSQAPGTALQPPQEPVSMGAPESGLPLPGLFFGAPAALGLALVLALVLVALASWRWQQRRTPEAPAGSQEEPLDNVYVPSPGTPEASAPVRSTPTEDPASSPPSHSVPVPATELGSTELVTTKTAGPEQQ